jgi:protein involved in polysaccharide export with SLBB domain
MKPRHLPLTLLLSLTAAVSAQTPARDLPLKEGDRVMVKLWMDTVFADTARVQQRGIVVLPRVGPVSIHDVPASLVADSIRSAYTFVFRALTVEVSPLRKVTIIGDVERPHVYYFDPLTLVRDAIAMAGGVTEIGRTNRAMIVRDSEPIRMKHWRLRADNDAYIRSGDVVIVEREPWIKRNLFTVLSGTSVLISIVLTLSNL